MSVPPLALVCGTPPPPDLVDEDVEREDDHFDLPYPEVSNAADVEDLNLDDFQKPDASSPDDEPPFDDDTNFLSERDFYLAPDDAEFSAVFDDEDRLFADGNAEDSTGAEAPPSPVPSTEDDFGEFDAYAPPESEECVAVLFPERVPPHQEPTAANELNKSLGQNWAHLIQYDAERSYLFPWNTSTTQKSLLKCLGIDSRNILLGPKWNGGMPRFAANLGVSPLQPIKQTSDGPKRAQGEPSPNVGDGTTGEDTAWSHDLREDANDFRASSYAESLLLDLEHLMATLDQMTSGRSADFKISDLFINACNERDDHLPIPEALPITESVEESGIPQSSVLNVGRKINLPDTHIFTPTDSETPWSHTIHYSDENFESFQEIIPSSSTYRSSHIDSIAIKETSDFDDFQSFQDSKLSENVVPPPPVENHVDSAPQTNDIDDFGDFQSAESKIPTLVKSAETAILEPVKLSMEVSPSLNWPAPGEVNVSVLDDFSDVNYTCSSSYLPTNISFPLKESKIVSDSVVTNTLFDLQASVNQSCPVIEPKNASTSMENSNHNQTTLDSIEKLQHSTESTLENDDFEDFKSAKFVPFADQAMSKKSNVNHTTSQTMSLGTVMLEPTPAYPNSKPTHQILQPLSLENYSHINWPDPGVSLNDLSRFNPIDSIKTYDGKGKESSAKQSTVTETTDDDGWSEFVSTKPNNAPTSLVQNGGHLNGADCADDDWSDFVSVPSISQNIQSQTSSYKSGLSFSSAIGRPNANHKTNINVLPHLSYVSPKPGVSRNYSAQFQNL